MRAEIYYPSQLENIWHTGKLGNVYRLDFAKFLLEAREIVSRDNPSELNIVNELDSSILKLAHSPSLIQAYKDGTPSELASSSGIDWQESFFPWVVNTAWAYIHASKEASVEKKNVLVLANPGHHAEYNSGFGFCAVNSFVIASKYLLDKGLVKKIGILDVDVHYGNGTHSLVEGDSRILSADIWKYKLDKWKYTDNGGNIFHINIKNVSEYFDALKKVLKRISSFSPDILFYHHGLDVLETDRMGGVEGFDEDVLMEREKIISRFLNDENIPTIFGPGGGYIDHANSEKVEEQVKRLGQLFYDSAALFVDL